ncbi:ankyrin repeat and fibronectin type-III domain-containing protein 1-like isoform X3 [Bolinopsis microptera]|uniref:ankyrin repeat and fibronectin type-III domain-containing protein 1-like isoform X3 n=1 Tax=Bolinopsis microptera TaxID=2820187 RepID=UPI003079EA1C
MDSAVCCNSILKRVSASRQPLVTSQVERWPGSNEMYSRKLLSNSTDRHKSQLNSSKQDLFALFDAIELSWYSKVCSLVTCPGLQINGLNEEGMTPLDVSLLLGDTPVARVLQHHGAAESMRYMKDPGVRYQHVLALLQETEINRTNVLSNPCTLSLTSDPPDSKGSDTDQKLWKYHRMLSTLKNTVLPGMPQRVSASVLSSTSIKLECYEPTDCKHSLITQYKVQRSSCPNFQSDVHTEIVSAGHVLSHQITGLKKGVCFYFTVQAGNIKGFGAPSPILKCTPSHWSDNAPPTDPLSHQSKCSNMLSDLRTHFNYLFPTLLSQTPTKCKPRSKSLSRIFTTPKFVKNLNRSLYLSVVHCTQNGKVLLTDFDKLPTIEVEDLVTAPSAETELLWLFKHALAGWPSTRELREELTPHEGVGGIGLRYKLLSAAIYLQDCLSSNDLGIPYYRLVKKNGQLLILLIKTVDPSTPPFGGIHFRNLSTLTSGIVQPKDAFDIAHLNASDLQTVYEQFEQPPTPGLFVGLLLFKMKGEELEIVVDKSCPLLPPLEYVREVGHVTMEEWDCLRRAQLGGAGNSVLCKQVSAAACALLSRVHDTESDIDNYAIFTKTIIEIGGTSVILIIPPQVVAPLGYDGDIDGTISVPLQNYEIFLNRVCRGDLTRSMLHVTTHMNTCHAILVQMIRQTISTDQSEQLRLCQDKFKKMHEEMCGVWSEYCSFSKVLSECMKEGDQCVRSISDLLRYAPNSPATSISDTLTSGADGQTHKQSGVVRIYSSDEVPVISPCIKLHITHTTTSRDVINSVIRKLRRQGAAGQLALEDCDLTKLSLVACVSNVKHHIPDTVQILQLGQPWINAKFHIRYID